MHNHNSEVVIQWIPGHGGIQGNEVADKLAKKGAALPQPDNPVTYDTVQKIFRLRTGHEPLNGFLRRIKKDHPARCKLCNHQHESVEHHLLYCPRLSDLRKKLLPPNPSISNTLFL